MKKIQVTIISENKYNKNDVNVYETTTLTSAVRIMMTFKPKRGYRVMKTMTEEVEVLV